METTWVFWYGTGVLVTSVDVSSWPNSERIILSSHYIGSREGYFRSQPKGRKEILSEGIQAVEKKAQQRMAARVSPPTAWEWLRMVSALSCRAFFRMACILSLHWEVTAAFHVGEERGRFTGRRGAGEDMDHVGRKSQTEAEKGVKGREGGGGGAFPKSTPLRGFASVLLPSRFSYALVECGSSLYHRGRRGGEEGEVEGEGKEESRRVVDGLPCRSQGTTLWYACSPCPVDRSKRGFPCTGARSKTF